MANTATQVDPIKDLGFLSSSDAILPKSETASREVQALKMYDYWTYLHDKELQSLKALVKISKDKSIVEARQKQSSDPDSERENLRELGNLEYTATIHLNQARGGIESFIRELTEKNPFDTDLSIFGERRKPLTAGEIMANLDMRFLINEDLKIRRRDTLETVCNAVYRYQTKDDGLSNATKLLEEYESQVTPQLLSRDSLKDSLATATTNLDQGKASEAIESVRAVLLPLRANAEASYDETTKLFLRACKREDILSNSLDLRIPANSSALSNEFLEYTSGIDQDPNASPSYRHMQRNLWDSEIPWNHDNSLALETDMTLAHILHASLKRLHYLGEAYQVRLDEIGPGTSTNESDQRKTAFRNLWQLYRQTEFLIGEKLEERLLAETIAKDFSNSELQDLAILSSLSQISNEKEFEGYQKFLGTGIRENNTPFLPSSHRVGLVVSKLLADKGLEIGNEGKALLQVAKSDPSKLAQYLELYSQKSNVGNMHKGLLEESEQYAAIQSLLNLVPENGPDSAFSKVKDFSNYNITREETLNLLYGVCFRLSELSERLNCGPGQLDGLLRDFQAKNMDKSNSEAIRSYTENLKSQLTGQQNKF